MRSFILLLTAAAALAALGLAVPSHAAAAEGRDGDFASLEEAVEAQVLDPAVLDDLRDDGGAEGFLVLEDEWWLETVRAHAGEDGLEPILPLLAERKSRLRERLGDGVEVRTEYEALTLELVRFRSPEALLQALNDPEVEGVGANNENEHFLAQSRALIRQPQTEAIGETGAGTSVAIIDTGINFARAEFGSCTAPGVPAACRVPFAADFAPNDNAPDDDGHGTNVAAIAAGVAPGTRLLSMDVFQRVFDPTTGLMVNRAADGDIINAVTSAILNQARFNIRALNLSLGRLRSFSTSVCLNVFDPYLSAFILARQVGILPVVSAGNSAFSVNATFTDGVTHPACVFGAVRVGAVYDANVGSQTWDGDGDGVNDCTDTTTAADQIACFSQTGAPLTLWAPGANINAGGSTFGGTSQAAPHVTGGVAVLSAAAQAGTGLAEIEAALLSGPPIRDPRNGIVRPRLDLRTAVALVAPCGGQIVTIRGTAGNDVLNGTPGPDVIAGLGGDDLVFAGGGDDRICAGEGSDSVLGGSGVDVLRGDEGNDLLFGEGDADVHFGDAGDDVLVGGASKGDILLGGPGARDLADYAGRSAAVTLSSDGFANDGEAGEGDNIATDVEDLTGGSGDDTLLGNGSRNELKGSGGSDRLRGGAGADELVGGPGLDWADYAERGSPLRVSADGYADDGQFGEFDNVRADVENVVGGSNDDRLVGNGSDNRLEGGDGHDWLYGASGYDTLVGGAGADALDGGGYSCNPAPMTLCVAPEGDTLDGGPGSDTASYDNHTVTVTVDLRQSSGHGAVGEGDTFTSIENVTGGSGDDVLIGDSLTNQLAGSWGNDTLDGGGYSCNPAPMMLCVAPDGDWLYGEEGVDTVSYSGHTVPVTVDLRQTSGQGAAGEGDRLATIENVTGGSGNDELLGNAAVNVLSGGDGDDYLDGLGGADDVRCGADWDWAYPDSADTAAADCEYVGYGPIARWP